MFERCYNINALESSSSVAHTYCSSRWAFPGGRSEWPITFCLSSDQTLPSSCQSACASLVQHYCQALLISLSWAAAIALPCYTQPPTAALTLFLAHLRTWLTPAKALRCEYCGPEIDTNGPLPGCKYRSKAIQDKFWTYTWSIFVAVWLTNLC